MDYEDDKNSSLREKAHEEEFERMKREEFSDADPIANGDGNYGGGFPNGNSKDVKTMSELRQQVLNDMTYTDTGSTATTKHLPNGSTDDVFFFNSALEWKPNVPLRVPMVYCDFTASHRPLNSIEDYIHKTCLPFYGNTHTNTSVTGSQSSAFVSEARQIIAEVCNAKITGKASQDVVLFAGNGTTGAVRLLIDCLGLKHFSLTNTDTSSASNGGSSAKRGQKPLIVLGPYEHHSNLLPWRELGGDKFVIKTARLTRDGSTVDMKDLERILIEHRKSNPDCPFMIGSFSAASNVTGVVVDDIAVTKLLHKHGALSFWDYATGASYLNVNVNPNPASLSTGDKAADIAKDAVFFSGHKLLGGGAGTPGVLIVKKRLVSSLNPPGQACGGGTVFYVTKDRHRFLSDRIERYEGGTPNVVGIWRLGLVWRLKLSLKTTAGKILSANKVGNGVGNGSKNVNNQHDTSSLLLEYDFERAKKIQEKLKNIRNLVLLDGKFSSTVKKLPIYSFLVRCGNKFLHYNYVCALLNDVFGIQSRGGCQCAGPYSQYLLGMNSNSCSAAGGCGSNEEVEDWLVRTKDELMRPGATRLSLPSMGTTLEQEDYVIEAIRWVAIHGWKLLHVYRCNHRSGEWRHKSRPGSPLGTHDRRWLSHYRMNTPSNKHDLEQGNGMSNDAVSPLTNAMKNADKILLLVTKDQSSISQTLKMVEEEESPSSLRWYVYPKDVARYLKDSLEEVPGTEDNCNIQGALQPIALRADDIEDAEIETNTTTEDLSSDPINEKEKEIPMVTMLHFRDGEHSGEATLEEIIEGHDDGELSDRCLIYDQTTDNWLAISSFIDRNNSAETEKEPIEFEDPIDEEVDVESPEVISHHIPSIEMEPTEDFQPVNKNDRKKPQRDVSAWGKGQVQPLTTKTEANEGAETESSISRRKKSKHIKPPAKLMRLCTQAMIQWDMLEDGDRLLLGLSGGKDSMSLLHVLLEFKKKLPIRFEIEVCTIDPMTPSFDPSPLIPYVESLGLKYHYIRDDIVERAASAGKDGKLVSSLCAFCARMKRGNLYSCARRNNCNKLVLAQHLDDLAESFMMSVMHNGFLRTMKANYKINAGDLSVIRPLAYCRESLMTEFAKAANLPIINENCPACFEEPKERARMKKLLSKEETLYPSFYDNIKRAMLPLMHDDATAIMRSYTDEAIAKSRKGVKKKPSDFKKKDVDNNGAGGNGVSGEQGKSSTMNGSIDNSSSRESTTLGEASEEMLVRELARRRASKHRLAGAMAMHSPNDQVDPTGQVCTLNGGNGTIPCRELME